MFLFAACVLSQRFLFISFLRDTEEGGNQKVETERIYQKVARKTGFQIGRFHNSYMLDFPLFSVLETMVTRTNKLVKLLSGDSKKNLTETPIPLTVY